MRRVRAGERVDAGAQRGNSAAPCMFCEESVQANESCSDTTGRGESALEASGLLRTVQ